MPPRKKQDAQPPPEDRYAPTTWGSDSSGLHELTVPSGQTCLVKRPGVQGLMAAGVLHNLDRLTALVDEQHVRRVKGQPSQVDVQSLMNDPEQIAHVLHTVDRIVSHVVVQPPVEMAPNDITSRKAGQIYTDMVEIEDKMFIFQFVVGGTRDLETFRLQLAESVGSVESEPDLEVPPE